MHEREQVRTVVRVVRRVAQGMLQSQLPRMAAALAYRTIFSIIPVFVISLLVVGSVVSDDQVESGIRRLLTYTGLDQISVEEVTPLDEEFVGPPSQADLQEHVEEQAAPAESPRERLDQLIRGLIDRVRTRLTDISQTSIAIVSTVILLYAALSMLVELERSFNQICRAPSGRPWMRRVVLYWAILTLGGLVVAATFSIGNQFLEWAQSLVGGIKAMAAVLGFVVTVAISTLLLVTAYLAIPNTRLRIRPVLAGAIVAAVLWELLKWGFRSYLEFSTGYANFYGNLALLPLFLLWVYATWLTVLFGLQVAYATQTFAQWDEEERDRAPALIDPACILPVAVAVARAFARGKPAGTDEVAREVGLSDALTSRMLDRLAACGFVHAVEVGEDRAFALARPAESIDAAEVLSAAAPLAERLPHGAEPALDELAAARDRALAGRSLADLMALTPTDHPGRSPRAG